MLILWDIDGTLLRTTHGVGREMYIRAFRSVLMTDVSSAVASMSFAGRTDRSLVHEIGASVGLPANDIEAAWPEIERDMITSARELIRPDTTIIMEGARQTIELLSAHGVGHALVTGNIEEIGYHKLSMVGLDGFFEHGAFGGHHADRRILPPLAIERYNAAMGTSYSTQQAVIVGDAIGDVDCARAHDIMSLAVTTGVQSADVLRQAGATYVIDSLHPADRTSKLIRTLLRRWIVMPVSPELVEHYHNTRFDVDGLGTLRIGKPLPESVITWLRDQGATMVALLGAENPQSTLTNDEDNAARHAALVSECTQRGLPFLPALGLTDDWRENHILVAGLTRTEADEFRRRYEQTTVLHAAINGTVELVGL
jgi:phosphoglycolate phosphatase-like HAD superfamily hydrolase